MHKFRLKVFRPIFPKTNNFIRRGNFIKCTITHVYQSKPNLPSMTNKFTWRDTHAGGYFVCLKFYFPGAIIFFRFNYNILRFSTNTFIHCAKADISYDKAGFWNILSNVMNMIFFDCALFFFSFVDFLNTFICYSRKV